MCTWTGQEASGGRTVCTVPAEKRLCFLEKVSPPQAGSQGPPTDSSESVIQATPLPNLHPALGTEPSPGLEGPAPALLAFVLSWFTGLPGACLLLTGALQAHSCLRVLSLRLLHLDCGLPGWLLRGCLHREVSHHLATIACCPTLPALALSFLLPCFIFFPVHILP